ncbi:hypothetical protein [Legionella massiliensis]|nr:hypothetical protein [Legionella massiliensis]
MRNLVDRINWTPIAPGYAEYLYEIEALRRNINFIKQEIYKELRDQENETATKEAILREQQEKITSLTNKIDSFLAKEEYADAVNFRLENRGDFELYLAILAEKMELKLEEDNVSTSPQKIEEFNQARLYLYELLPIEKTEIYVQRIVFAINSLDELINTSTSETEIELLKFKKLKFYIKAHYCIGIPGNILVSELSISQILLNEIEQLPATLTTFEDQISHLVIKYDLLKKKYVNIKKINQLAENSECLPSKIVLQDNEIDRLNQNLKKSEITIGQQEKTITKQAQELAQAIQQYESIDKLQNQLAEQVNQAKKLEAINENLLHEIQIKENQLKDKDAQLTLQAKSLDNSTRKFNKLFEQQKQQNAHIAKLKLQILKSDTDYLKKAQIIINDIAERINEHQWDLALGGGRNLSDKKVSETGYRICEHITAFKRIKSPSKQEVADCLTTILDFALNGLNRGSSYCFWHGQKESSRREYVVYVDVINEFLATHHPFPQGLALVV